MKIKMDKNTLLDALQANQTAHKEEYEQAMDGYIKECEEWLADRLKEVHASEVPDMTSFSSIKPANHNDDYETAISMLRHDMSAQVDIDQAQYQRYVENKWEWRDLWMLSNSRYLGR